VTLGGITESTGSSSADPILTTDVASWFPSPLGVLKLSPPQTRRYWSTARRDRTSLHPGVHVAALRLTPNGGARRSSEAFGP
jgi:hypothetical protein